MAWAAISDRTSYEKASEIADKYDLACVSVAQYFHHEGKLEISPIETRIRNGPFMLNYLADGKVRRTNAYFPTRSYCAYYYVPSKIRYTELLSYLYKHWRPYLQGVVPTVLLYMTESKERFIYFSHSGIVHFQLEAPLENPLLYFETGHWTKGKPIDEHVMQVRKEDDEK